MLDLLQTTRYPVNHPFLKKLIKYYWVIQSQAPIEVSHKLLPVSNIDFILNFSSPIQYLKRGGSEIVQTGFHFNGIRDRYCLIRQKGILRIFGISFFPTGLFPLLKIPLSEFKDKTIELDLTLKNFTEIIINKIDTTQPIAEIISVIENQLLQSIDISLVPSKETLKIFEVFNEDIKVCNINSLCKQHGINQRRLERLFNKYVGISPKLFHRINRFQEVINNIEKISTENFTSIAYNNNYYDQTHFIKDFKLFTNTTPVEFANQNKAVKQIIKYY